MIADPNKPKTPLCKLSALMRWTTWSKPEISMLVATGKLQVFRFKPNGYARYYVASAQAILDKMRAKRAKLGRIGKRR